MKQLLYLHSVARPIVASLNSAVMAILGRRLLPLGRRLLPSPAGRRVVAGLLLALSLVVQVVLLILLSQVIELCINLAELWAILAGKYVELNP
jgi:hypothetical protein